MALNHPSLLSLSCDSMIVSSSGSPPSFIYYWQILDVVQKGFPNLWIPSEFSTISRLGTLKFEAFYAIKQGFKDQFKRGSGVSSRKAERISPNTDSQIKTTWCERAHSREHEESGKNDRSKGRKTNSSARTSADKYVCYIKINK